MLKTAATLLVTIVCAGAGAAPGVSSPGKPNQWDPEIAALTLEMERHPASAEAHYKLAVALRRVGRRSEALPHFEKAAALGPAAADRLRDLAACYADLSFYPQAERTYERLLEIGGEDSRTLHALAHIAFRRGEFDRAIEMDRKAVAIDPGYLYGIYHLGLALKFAGREQEAEEAFLRILDLKPGSDLEKLARIDALYQLGSLYVAKKSYEKAETVLAEAIRLAPEHAGAHYARAQALRHLGREQEARQEIAAHLSLVAQRKPTGASASSP